MQRTTIPFEKFSINPFEFWKQGLLLTPGMQESGQFNPMTIGWGSIGWYWNRPVIQVVVRPTRYTYSFIENFESFTVCAFPEQYKEALTLCGTKSGRDMDKVKTAGLSLLPSTQIAAPGYDEAELIIECKKIYSEDLKPEAFIGTAINVDHFYPKRDFHRVYYGEILIVSGNEKYLKP